MNSNYLLPKDEIIYEDSLPKGYKTELMREVFEKSSKVHYYNAFNLSEKEFKKRGLDRSFYGATCNLNE